ncbi:MAG: hypothetical protein HYV97_11105 [Bdellovibrio sp.]|nr:hypothetical protein [Bdellovibrio sp.]
MKKLLLYACVASLFYIQLAMPFLTFNIFPNVISGVAYAADTCDEEFAKANGTSCAEIRRLQEGKEIDCAALRQRGEEGKAEQDAKLSEENKEDSDKLTDQFAAIKANKPEDSALFITADVLTGIMFLAMAFVSLFLVLGCTGKCAAGTIAAAAGGAFYLAGEVQAWIRYADAMNQLGANEEAYLKCEAAQGLSRKKAEDTSGTAELSESEFAAQEAQLTVDEKKVINSAQFGALEKQKEALNNIRDIAITKAWLQGASAVSFLTATGIEIGFTISDNAAMTSSLATLKALNVELELMAKGAAASAGGAVVEIDCNWCKAGSLYTMSHITAYQTEYNQVFSNTCVPPAALSDLDMARIEVICDGWTTTCMGVSTEPATIAYTAVRAEMKSVSINLQGNLFPHCTPPGGACGAMCKLVDVQRFFTPMSEEQKVALEGKNWMMKIIDFIFPAAEASAGDWIKGIGLTAAVLVVLFVLFSGYTNLSSKFLTRPPQRIVLFSVMSVLAIAAWGVTMGVISEMDSRIATINELLSKWKNMKGEGTSVEERPTPTPTATPNVGATATPAPGASNDTATPTPTPTPTPPPVIDESSIDGGIKYRNYADNDTQENKSVLASFTNWIVSRFKSSVEDALAATSTGMSFTLPKNKKFPCFGKEEGGKCPSQSKSQMEQLAKVPNLPPLLAQQGNRAILLAKEVSGARGISNEAMNLAKTMGKDIANTQATMDKLEKLYDQKQVENYQQMLKTKNDMINAYNALSDEAKEKIDPSFLGKVKEIGKNKPMKLKENRQGFFNQMKKIAEAALSKMSSSARENFKRNKSFSMGVAPERIQQRQTAITATSRHKPEVVIDGGFETAKTDPSIAQNLKKDNNDGIDDLEVTVDDINKGEEISIFQLISQRYRRIFNIAE